jgi:putative DNA primase/helicase
MRRRPQAPEPRHRPLIELADGTLDKTVDASQRVLAVAGNIFQRGGRLVRTIRTAEPTATRGLRRSAGALVIAPVTADWLRLELARHAGFTKFDGRTDSWRPKDCPIEVAAAIIANAGAWPFPVLAGVVTAPTLRPDGSTVETPGYDAASGLYLELDEEFPPVPRKPTREDAQRALSILREPFSQFPFAKPEHESVALSAMLTAIVRPAMRTAPAHGFSAPTMASGKSLLGDVAALAATGRTAATMSAAPSGEEEQKRILALYAEGEQVVMIDNVETSLGSDVLCTVLTQTTFKGRVLGESRTITVPTGYTTLLFSGNNLQVVGDLSTRTLLCRLDPRCERPEDRAFSVNLHEWVPANRPALVIAALTLLRGYISAGRPAQPFKRLGRFEDWSDLVRSALVWAGMQDPVLTRAEVQAQDPIKAALSALLISWHAAFKGTPVSTSTLIHQAKQRASSHSGDASLINAIEEIAANPGGEINARRLGKWLAKYADRVQDGYVLERAGEGSSALWRVRCLEQV